jgi:hypothetical protein
MSKARITSGVILGMLLVWSVPGVQPQAPSSFAERVASLSEPGGYFDTDNLISNERSYLEVLPELKRIGVRGGAYIGVGPDQNFTYIAAVRPSVALIVDIRRDNLLLHLLLKALFEMARTRVEYVSLLFGRAPPADLEGWRTSNIDRLVAHLNDAAPTGKLDDKAVGALRARVDDTIRRTGIPLTADDRATIDRFHRRFIESGTALRFQSTGRPPQSHYPTYAELLRATDPDGRQGNYLASEETFQFIRGLQQQDLVIPVVGDLAGPRAMSAVGTFLQERKERVTAFYTSNVEFYLFGDGRFSSFVTNLNRVPRGPKSVIIRSVFGRYAWPAGGSSSHVQPVADLVEGHGKGRYQYYGELVGAPR